ncbi:heme exporter protein CcmD [Spongiibacter nanhainus]|uniref:Heme exporter protein D n=2 Tax=Spongiibacter nanhainus TaxID=2794344 RepID=A0A7T4UNN9_9GAMM|nr:heme exporter protein CcmD [Spongiibacter nanhainus]
MEFESLQALLVMDGHGSYVWFSYAVTLLVLCVAVVAPLRRQRGLKRQIASLARRPNARRPSARRQSDPE